MYLPLQSTGRAARASPCAPGRGEQAAAACPARQPCCAHSCSAHPPRRRIRHGGVRRQARPRLCATMLTGQSPPAVAVGVLHRLPPPCRGTDAVSHAVAEQLVSRARVQQQTFVCIYLLAAAKEIIPALPTRLLFLIHWEQTGHLYPFPGLFWFSGSSLLTTCPVLTAHW